ncbi:TraB/GumN family protein [Stakelama marina]|uniref:TraB/GumN family protein n=1 Tax=Stakelama marina TaxID=2826939 RepID=A0A8T4IBI4_9SPHN|nr:TraB/GumN family protein [Stakelama marina]MBR0552378.1 TraB/GumN family protein [Stakelama marina]
MLIQLIAALAIALAATGCQQQETAKATPALWRVSDGDTVVWLFGSIHLLPPELRWRTPALARAIDRADLLVLEIPPGDPARQSATFLRMARADDLPPIAERLPEAQRPLLAKAAHQAGVDTATLDGLKSWGAALMLASGAGREDGATRDAGVEAALTRDFSDKGKHIAAFETLTGQLGLFDALDERAQRHLLARAVADAASPGGGYAETLAAWRAGDAKRLEASFNPLFAGEPALETALLTGRNARWSDWIARRMRNPGRVLVAVGAGHLVGPKSVVAMLRKRGFTVERVE